MHHAKNEAKNESNCLFLDESAKKSPVLVLASEKSNTDKQDNKRLITTSLTRTRLGLFQTPRPSSGQPFEILPKEIFDQILVQLTVKDVIALRKTNNWLNQHASCFLKDGIQSMKDLAESQPSKVARYEASYIFTFFFHSGWIIGGILAGYYTYQAVSLPTVVNAAATIAISIITLFGTIGGIVLGALCGFALTAFIAGIINYYNHGTPCPIPNVREYDDIRDNIKAFLSKPNKTEELANTEQSDNSVLINM